MLRIVCNNIRYMLVVDCNKHTGTSAEPQTVNSVEFAMESYRAN